ncbi:MAG TPA: Ig-like domain-containing protein [Actinomycetota bacterium]|nr:Ig-like domain-containing protein [Actinomycetota bacterium]
MNFRPRVLSAIAVAACLVAPLAQPVAAAGSCQRQEDWAEMKGTWAAEVLALTNAHRATLGLAPLAPSESLTAAATWKAAHMAAYEYMAHDDPAPPVDRSWDQRIRDCGYASGAGENIAYGYRSPAAVFAGWLGSAGHRRNIENPSYKVLGVGAAVAADGTPYWAQVFGLRVEAGDSVPVPPPPPPPSEPTPTPAPTAPPTGAAPVVRDDVVTVPEDTSARIAPLQNDSGIVGVSSLGQPQHGSVTLGDGNEVVYVPDKDFHGSDSFTYAALDAGQATVAATVTVTVQPLNDAPVAAADEAVARPRRVVTIDVLGNDGDADGDRLRVREVVRAPYYGSVEIDGNALVYRARRGSAGRYDRIKYRVSDGNGGADTATVTVRIAR